MIAVATTSITPIAILAAQRATLDKLACEAEEAGHDHRNEALTAAMGAIRDSMLTLEPQNIDDVLTLLAVGRFHFANDGGAEHYEAFADRAVEGLQRLGAKTVDPSIPNSPALETATRQVSAMASNGHSCAVQ